MSKRGWFYRFAERWDTRLENDPRARLVALVFAGITFASVIAAMIGVYVQVSDSALLRKEIEAANQQRIEERVDRARDRIRRREAGDTGKGLDITVLSQNNALSSVLDLSCATVGLIVDGRCVGEPVFSGVDITGFRPDIDLARGGLRLILSNTLVSDSALTGMDLLLTVHSSRIENTDLTGAGVRPSGGSISLMGSDLAGVYLELGNSLTNLTASNLSGTRIVLPEDVRCQSSEKPRFDVCSWSGGSVLLMENFYWIDYPPVIERSDGSAVDFQHSSLVCGFSPRGRLESEPRRIRADAVQDLAPLLEEIVPDSCELMTSAQASALYPMGFPISQYKCLDPAVVQNQYGIRRGEGPEDLVCSEFWTWGGTF